MTDTDRTRASVAPPVREEPAVADGLAVRRDELRWIVLFWTCMALLTAANRLLGPRLPGVEPPGLDAALGLAFIESYLWAALTPFIFALSRRFPVERARRLPALLAVAAAGFATAVAMDLVDDVLRVEVFHVPRPGQTEVDLLRGVTRFWFLNDLITFIAVLAAGFARAYFLRYRTRREETVRLQARTARLEAQLAEARLAALRNQLDPHFLFNTLHAVSALVERDPGGVRRMIARLSELLRHTLEDAREPEVPLEQELALVERYVEIMRIRFQGRLQVETRADPSVADALVPNLVLQPLVENAIKHGVSDRNGPGRLVIEVRRDGERVVLSVRDNGPSTDGANAGGDGVGLRTTRARLAQLYGDQQRLTLRALPDGGTRAEVVLPYHTRADLRSAAADVPP